MGGRTHTGGVGLTQGGRTHTWGGRTHTGGGGGVERTHTRPRSGWGRKDRKCTMVIIQS